MITVMFLIAVIVSPLVADIRWIYEGDRIQDAVNASADGDTLVLDDGTYVESVILRGARLVIASRYLLDGDTAHISGTIVTADTVMSDTNSCFVYAYGEPIGGKLIGITLSDGRGTYCSHTSGRAGGNVYIHSSAVTIERCNILRGEAHFGGGLFVYEYFYTGLAVCTLLDCSVSECRSSGWGGAVYASDCSLRVTSCTFDADTAVLMGAAISADNSFVGLDSCHFLHGYGESGGVEGISCRGHILNSVFEINGTSGAPLGCHLQLAYSRVLISRNIFRENSVDQIPIILLGGGYSNPIQFIGNLVENNQAITRTGILLCGGDAVGDIAYNVIRNNVTSYGSAIQAFDDSHPRIHHNYFDGNVSLDSSWGAVFISVSGSYPVIDSNTIVHHRPPIMSLHSTSPRSIDARYNYWGHPTGPYHATLNPQGQGDTLVSDSVRFVPWLTQPPDTALPLAVMPERSGLDLATWQLTQCFPNPFNSMMQIVLAGFTGDHFELTLHNLLGQIVDVIHRGPLTGGQFTYTAPPYLSSGVYLVSAHDKHSVQTKKVVLLK